MLFRSPWSEIVLAACGANELLPMEEKYPADLFTACLTTPIKTGLRWFVLSNLLSMKGVDPAAVEHLPGRLNDRKTALGELNWIFTSVTDTIAWNSLPQRDFHGLFRQDLLVASLFRNFLLADRLMRSLGCTPETQPRLPPGIHLHPLWQSWDLAAESSLLESPHHRPRACVMCRGHFGFIAADVPPIRFEWGAYRFGLGCLRFC